MLCYIGHPCPRQLYSVNHVQLVHRRMAMWNRRVRVHVNVSRDMFATPPPINVVCCMHTYTPAVPIMLSVIIGMITCVMGAYYNGSSCESCPVDTWSNRTYASSTSLTSALLACTPCTNNSNTLGMMHPSSLSQNRDTCVWCDAYAIGVTGAITSLSCICNTGYELSVTATGNRLCIAVLVTESQIPPSIGHDLGIAITTTVAITTVASSGTSALTLITGIAQVCMHHHHHHHYHR